MNFIDYNFVSDDVAKNIMESYGYVVPGGGADAAPTDPNNVHINESSAAPELPDYVCVVNETTYALCEGVEEVDGQLFIPVMEVKAELHEALAENDTTLLESVEMDDTSYTFGDIFEDEQTGEMFIAINEAAGANYEALVAKRKSQAKTPKESANVEYDLAHGGEGADRARRKDNMAARMEKSNG